MASIDFGLSSYERARGDLPELPVINMFAEEAPTEGKVILQSRPGLVDREKGMGEGPIDVLFQRDLVLNGALFGVSDTKLYRRTDPVGQLNGTGPFSIAGYENYIFVAGGRRLFGYNGTTFEQITFPDDAYVSKVLIAASRLVAISKDTGTFYWTPPLGLEIDPLDFATAENAPDRLLDALFIDDVLLLFGSETVEFWPNTNDPDLPFQPLEGRVIEKGIRATGCAVGIGSTFAWVTNENQVCIADENTVLSNEGLEEKIAASTKCRLFKFLIGSTEFLALRIDTETHVWNSRIKRWSQFASNEQDNWLPQAFAGGVFGSAIDGRTFAWSDGYADPDGELERRFRGGFPLNSGGVRIDNVQLRTNVGQTSFLNGEFAEPVMEMRLSRDVGQTWGPWKQASLGRQGEYRKRVQWRSCGMASQPGFLAEFRCTAPVSLRVSDVLLNEGGAGR